MSLVNLFGKKNAHCFALISLCISIHRLSDEHEPQCAITASKNKRFLKVDTNPVHTQNDYVPERTSKF
jgi:hypothetical protein